MNKLFFFDIDGTLTVQGVTPKEHLDALSLLRQKGYLTFICTGRAPFYAQKLYKDLVSGYVTCNGRYILYQGNALYKKAFTKEEFAFYTERFDQLGCGYFMVSDEKMFLKGVEGMSLKRAAQDYGEERFLTAPGNLPYYTLDLFYKNTDHRDRIIQELKDILVINDHGGKGSADCSTIDFDKGHAIAYLMNYFHIDADHCYAFGDGYNDQAMFREAGNRIAMGNAVDVLKEKASYVTTAVNDGGIMHALKHLGVL